MISGIIFVTWVLRGAQTKSCRIFKGFTDRRLKFKLENFPRQVIKGVDEVIIERLMTRREILLALFF